MQCSQTCELQNMSMHVLLKCHTRGYCSPHRILSTSLLALNLKTLPAHAPSGSIECIILRQTEAVLLPIQQLNQNQARPGRSMKGTSGFGLTRSLSQGLAGSRCSELIAHPHSSKGTLSCQAHHTRRSPT